MPPERRAVVAGHSLGAMSIASWAEQHDVERRVRAAALLNTGVGDLVAEHLLLPLPGIAQALNRAIALRGFLGSQAPLPRFSTPLSYAAVRYIAFGPDASPAQVAFFERMLVTCPPDVRADIGIAMSEMDLHHALPRLTVPTIVIAGADDKLTPPSHARRIAEMLPQLRRLTVLEHAGHMTPLERPDVVIEALAELAALTAERVVGLRGFGRVCGGMRAVSPSSPLCHVLSEDPELADAIPPERREQAVEECTAPELLDPAGPLGGPRIARLPRRDRRARAERADGPPRRDRGAVRRRADRRGRPAAP